MGGAISTAFACYRESRSLLASIVITAGRRHLRHRRCLHAIRSRRSRTLAHWRLATRHLGLIVGRLRKEHIVTGAAQARSCAAQTVFYAPLIRHRGCTETKRIGRAGFALCVRAVSQSRGAGTRNQRHGGRQACQSVCHRSCPYEVMTGEILARALGSLPAAHMLLNAGLSEGATEPTKEISGRPAWFHQSRRSTP